MPGACSVKGCRAHCKQTYRFPVAHLHRERFLKWLAVAGNKDFLGLTPTQLRLRRICAVHFEKKYQLARRLSSTAVPTLNLPDEIDVSSYNIDDIDEPVAKKFKPRATNYRHYSIRENISRYEKRSLIDIAFDAAVKDSPINKIFSSCEVNENQECPENSLPEPQITLAEEIVDGSETQPISNEPTIVKNLAPAATVRTYGKRKNRVLFSVMTADKMCTLCKAFSKAGMRTHMIKLHRAMEQDPSEETMNFIRSGLQALTNAVLNREK